MVKTVKCLTKTDTISHGNKTPTVISPVVSKGINIHQLDDLAIASWNLQGGLNTGAEFQCVARDLGKRKVDIGCLQETHVRENVTMDCEEGKLICLDDLSMRTPVHYGLGFFVGKSLMSHVIDYRLVSNRIAILRLHNTSSGEGSNHRRKFSTICIVNVYAPTSQRAVKNPEEYNGFYRQLGKIVRECSSKSSSVIVAGDFNSKLGLRGEAAEGGVESCLGEFGKGTRNRNGRYMVNFLNEHKLYAANTHCRQSLRHRSTWHGQIKVGEETRRIMNQIDYVCVQQRMKRAIMGGRSYWGYDSKSDHAIVVVRIRMNAVYQCRKGASSRSDIQCGGHVTAMKPDPLRKLHLNSLVSSPEVRGEYQEKIRQLSLSSGDDSSCAIGDVRRAALATIPGKEVRAEGRINYYDDERLKQLSSKQANLLLELRTMSGEELQKREEGIRKARSNLKLKIGRRIRQLQQQMVNEMATELENTKDSQRQFAVCRSLKKKAPFAQYQLKDEHGFVSSSPAKTIPMTEDFYKQFFNPPVQCDLVDPWGVYVGALDKPLTEAEIECAVGKLSNGRAVGPDGIPGELLKYGGAHIVKTFAAEINNSFVNRVVLPYLNEGILVPLNKPGKPYEVKQTRPITLLNTRRKVLSIAILDRIAGSIDKFLPRSQCGFRRRRSSIDVAWVYGWLKAVCHRYQRAVHVIGIDMSKAFDSIVRKKLLFILDAQVGLKITELRLIQTLLAGTSLQVKVSGYLGKKFSTSLGVPQGDALSPCLFVVYLEAAMREVRQLDCGLYNSTYIGRDWFHEIMEASYADDVDMLCVDKDRLDERLLAMVPIFLQYNLTVNQGKTERICICNDHRANIGYKKLGSHVDAVADLRMRITKAYVAFTSMWKLWKCTIISIPTRLRMYNACVVPILLYNIGAQAFTDSQVCKLEAAHRKHLRCILGVFYPDAISTEELYRRTQSHYLRVDIIKARWRCLKYGLLQDIEDERLPMPCVMRMFFHNHFGAAVKMRGSPPTSIPVLIHKDMLLVGRKFQAPEDYKDLKELVLDRQRWREMVVDIVSIATAKVLEANAKKRAKRKEREASQVDSETQEGSNPKRRRTAASADTPAICPPAINVTPSGSDVSSEHKPNESVRPSPRTRSCTKKQCDSLRPIPDDKPLAKRQRIQVHNVDTDANITRNSRLDACLNVHNSVISGRTF